MHGTIVDNWAAFVSSPTIVCMCAGRRFKRSECLLSEPLYTAVTAVAFYLAAPHEFLISLIFFFFFLFLSLGLHPTY